jgi:hypothetical protein
MANNLLNGPQAGDTSPAAQPNEGIPTFGYHPDGRAEIFHLKPGEKLPDGWFDSPQEPRPQAGIVAETAADFENPKDPEPDGNGS